MKLSDRDLKSMYTKVSEIRTEVAVIKTKCTSMEKHLTVQNGRLNKHATAIQNISVTQEGIKTKFWFVMVLVGVCSGIGGGIISTIVGGII